MWWPSIEVQNTGAIAIFAVSWKHSYNGRVTGDHMWSTAIFPLTKKAFLAYYKLHKIQRVGN